MWHSLIVAVFGGGKAKVQIAVLSSLGSLLNLRKLSDAWKDWERIG